MATRPWVTPAELLEYTANESIKARTEKQLSMDIARAERYVIGYCQGNDFTTIEQYPEAYKSVFPEIPEDVKTAVILIAEINAAKAQASADGQGTLFRSESLDDYSYTLQDTNSAIDNMLIGPLLDDFVLRKTRYGVKMDAHAW